MLDVCALLKIAKPLIQAPMAGVQDYRLALAVAKAGGLGSIPCAMLSIEQIHAQVNAFKAQSDASYNLNFFCHTATQDAQQELIWREQLAPYFKEFEVGELKASAGRVPFNQEIFDALAPLNPPIFSFHFGLPSADLVAKIKALGAVIISSATSVAEGIWLEENGADIVIAQGVEAGGHRAMFLETDISRQQGTFTLLPQLVQALQVPIVAAGGIADKQAITAAVALGASAVQIGTSYLLCDEATTSALHREVLTSDQAATTCLTNVFSGRPARGIVNRAIRELGPISDKTPPFPTAATAITQLRQAAEQRGSSDFSPLWSGCNNSGCKAISATELTDELFTAFDI
ncbi:MAG: nitronate monooxygenase [Oceanospirillaceae bacterium]|nr:nitronate monooxygenase [Oceanospirillaceae bacterium]